MTPATQPPVYVENLNLSLICKDCRIEPPNLIEEFSSGDMVCADCGLVLGDRIIDTRSEWRTFANDESGGDDPSRVGNAPNPLQNGSGLETTIGQGDSARARNLRATSNKQNNSGISKTQSAAFNEVSAHCEAMSIPKNTGETAKMIFKLVDDAKVCKGKSADALIASSIFLACRQSGIPRTFREIFHQTKVPKKEIGRTFKLVEKFLTSDRAKEGMNMAAGGGSNQEFKSTSSTSAKDLCNRFCNQLGLHKAQFLKVSQGLAENNSSVGDLSGRSPLSVAGACIYMASALLGKPKSAKEIATIAGVSDGTIRTAYKYLYMEREKLIEPEWIANGKGKMENLPPS